MRHSATYERIQTLAGGFKYVTLRSGREVTFTEAVREAEGSFSAMWRWASRMHRLARIYDDVLIAEWDWERIEQFIDEVEVFVETFRKEIKKHRVQRSKTEKIQALRNVQGRTPEEAAAFRAKADALEAKL